MQRDMIIALVGVGGTIGGTIVGAILSWLGTLIANRGKINIYINSYKGNFLHMGDPKIYENENSFNSKSYNYDLSLDMYNSSNSNKILRDIKVCFCNSKRTMLVDKPINKNLIDTDRKIKRINILNLAPKEVYSIKLRGNIQNDDDRFPFIEKSNEIYLTYKDKNDRLQKVLLEKCHYINDEKENQNGQA